MESSLIGMYDQEEVYCKKLGHHLQFKYCKQEQQQLPCNMLKECWKSRILVDEFLLNSFPEAEITHLDEHLVSKMFSIMDIVRNVQKKSNSD